MAEERLDRQRADQRLQPLVGLGVAQGGGPLGVRRSGSTDRLDPGPQRSIGTVGEVLGVDVLGDATDHLGVLYDQLEGLALEHQPRVAWIGKLGGARRPGDAGWPGSLSRAGGGLRTSRWTSTGSMPIMPASSREKASTFDRSRIAVTSLAASRMASIRPSARSRS